VRDSNNYILDESTERYHEDTSRKEKNEERALMSPEEKRVAQYGDPGQAGRLIVKKRMA